MQPGIQGEILLPNVIELTLRLSPVENHIPTMPGDGRGNQDEQMVPKELITETLLPEPTPPNVPV